MEQTCHGLFTNSALTRGDVSHQLLLEMKSISGKTMQSIVEQALHTGYPRYRDV